jgi:hypothetical protein
MKIWEKYQNNKYGYGIEVFPKKKNVFVPYPIKTQCFKILLFFFPKDNHEKNSPMFYSNSNGDKNYVNNS